MKKYILFLLWSVISFGQASNQMVTFTAAQSLGFSLKSGQSSVTSTQCMTKTDIQGKYNVTISGYANNQLVPRSAWTSAVPYYSYPLFAHATFGTSATCTGPLTDANTMYSPSNVIQVPMTFYTNTAMTTVFTGGNLAYYYNTGNQLLTIDNSGVLTAIAGCSATDTTPPAAPTLSITVNSQNQITLSWNIPTDASGISTFLVYYGTSSNPGYYDSYTGTTTTVTIGGNAPSTTYYAKIQAIDGANNYSPFSATVNIATGFEVVQ